MTRVKQWTYRCASWPIELSTEQVSENGVLRSYLKDYGISLIAQVAGSGDARCMADVLPFRRKSAPPSKCSFSGCSSKLTCPACAFKACSSDELHAHVAEMHPALAK